MVQTGVGVYLGPVLASDSFSRYPGRVCEKTLAWVSTEERTVLKGCSSVVLPAAVRRGLQGRARGSCLNSKCSCVENWLR